MIQPKNKKCVECGREDLPHFSKKRCKNCATKAYKITKSTPKPKRKEAREGFAEFFMKHVTIIQEQGKTCANCGDRLRGHVSEVAHVLAKTATASPEVATNDDNVIYMCGMFSKNQCHAEFDKALSTRVLMPVFTLAKERYEKLKPFLLRVTKECLIFEEN